MKNSHNKSKILGMNYGTASNRLRKQLLFKYVQMAKEDNCYRCGKQILTVNEFSIDHKESWENISKDLFWNLDNIAFSHLKCNIKAANREDEKNRIGKSGEKYITVRKDTNKFCVAVRRHKNTCVYLGDFLNIKDAITARDLFLEKQ